MAFNLPPPWDAGYALPGNVRDEGLQRRAFVTKQMPRGTYDAPAVNVGGYAVPQYVMDEGYGQGTYTTKWQPSGTYSGPKVAHWLNQRPQLVGDRRISSGQQLTFQRKNMQALGGISGGPMPQALQTYGNRAATVLLAHMSRLPANKRRAALKTTLDKVDPTLFNRAATLARQYNRQGMRADQAVHQGLARAMSSGIAAEIVNTGLRRSAPQARSLLGLGCYGGKAALGADAPGVILGSYQTAPTCAAPAGYKWDGTTWVRLKAGEAPQLTGAPCGAGGAAATVTVNDQRGVSTSTGVTPYQWLQIGPMQFAADVRYATGSVEVRRSNPDYVFMSPARLPAEVAGWIRGYLAPGGEGSYTIGTPQDGESDYITQLYLNKYSDAAAWFQAFGMPAGSKYAITRAAFLDPIVRSQNPVTGDNLAIYTRLEPLDRKTAWNAQTNPLALKFWLVKVPDSSVLKDIWDSLIWVAATVTDVISDVLDELGGLACDILQSPVGTASGAAAAAAAGAPPQAGVAGATIAKNACGVPPPPPLPPAPSSLLPVALLAGGAVLVVALLTKKKKAP